MTNKAYKISRKSINYSSKLIFIKKMKSLRILEIGLTDIVMNQYFYNILNYTMDVNILLLKSHFHAGHTPSFIKINCMMK